MGGVREFVPSVSLFEKCKAAAVVRDTATATAKAKAKAKAAGAAAASAIVMTTTVVARARARATAESRWPISSHRTVSLPTYRPLEPWQTLGAIVALERSSQPHKGTEANCRHCLMNHHSWMHQHLKLTSFPCPIEQKLQLLDARPKLPSQMETPMSRQRLRRMLRRGA
jgi:hypothetical protein